MRHTRLLSRRPEGEELRAADDGGKNGVRSVRKELQDIAGRICLGYKEIARAVKGQATRVSKPSSISALIAGWSELENCVASGVAKERGKTDGGTEEVAGAIEGQAEGICAGCERAWPRENGARSIRSEFIDRLGAAVGCIEIARAIKSQALVCLQKIVPRRTGNGAENKSVSTGCKLEDFAGATVVICRHDIGIARHVRRQPYEIKLSGAAHGTDVVAQVEFQDSPNHMVVPFKDFRCEKIAEAVKGQPSRVL